ncbi:MFS transporter, DHA1 family, bicyclomycin/chloramphenicol resistance protein [Rosenbergiella nectarea]|uniref:MFS transporter, DHA1 family, bicyclomycin/chloramphenicol resistance protein n=1 Tax=Rosenbergiella nectarea TaxID=988801 RepID=A0A1H9DDG4_9GAMM|nr:MFS transporter [Rosenbergiella nectarea]SEQ11510.1 MFS transporter, DHA1 family, bicyclomycin/chloramphenicol resistance protein [Rosenbergiella nectarea]
MRPPYHRPVSTEGLPFILILSALMAFTSLSVDIYLPAMPMMSASLHGNTELTITGFLIGFCLAQLVWGTLCWLPETLPPQRRVQASLLQVFGNYRDLLGHRQFMRFTLALTFYYVSAYTFITASPFVYINYFHVSPQHFGYFFAVNILGVMGMNMINRRLVHRFALERLLKIAVTLSASAMGLLAVTTYLSVGGLGLMMGLVFIFFAMNGVIASVTTAAALDTVPQVTGAASALMGSLQYGSGILSSALLALFNSGTPFTMALMMASFTLASFVMSYLAKE